MKRFICLILLVAMAMLVIPEASFETFAAASEYSGCVDWKDAGRYEGKTITIYGDVYSTYYAKNSNGRPTFINFTQPYTPGKIYVVIFEQNRGKFSSAPERMFANRKIKVTGKVKRYQDRYEIIVTKPSQIEIMK